MGSKDAEKMNWLVSKGHFFPQGIKTQRNGFPVSLPLAFMSESVDFAHSIDGSNEVLINTRLGGWLLRLCGAGCFSCTEC